MLVCLHVSEFHGCAVINLIKVFFMLVSVLIF